MKARTVAVVGMAAAAGAAAFGAHHLRDAPANMRRYSMPSVGVYDLVTHLLFRGRYDEIARAIAAEAPDGATVVDLGSGTGEVLVRLGAPGAVARAHRRGRRSRDGRPSTGEGRARHPGGRAPALVRRRRRGCAPLPRQIGGPRGQLVCGPPPPRPPRRTGRDHARAQARWPRHHLGRRLATRRTRPRWPRRACRPATRRWPADPRHTNVARSMSCGCC